MSRRGPQAKFKPVQRNTNGSLRHTDDVYTHPPRYGDRAITRSYNVQGKALPGIAATPSSWPSDLDATEYMLLDHYVHRFSRTYPTFSGPSNPFLQIVVPLAMQNRAVLDALLALSGVQSWHGDASSMEHAMLVLRQKALQGCRSLLTSEELARTSALTNQYIHNKATQPCSDHFSSPNIELLFVLASCGMLLLYEKLSDEGSDNCTPHLQFFSRLLTERVLPAMSMTTATSERTPWIGAFTFLRSLFLYNDLVRATSLEAPVMSKAYLDLEAGDKDPSWRFYFPHLISRMSHKDPDVRDDEIIAWNGRLDWIPSYALTSETGMSWPTQLLYQSQHILGREFEQLSLWYETLAWDDRTVICELYRIAAMIYRRQSSSVDISSGIAMGHLPSWAIQLMHLLPLHSAFSNMLLWPMGITAKELTRTHLQERRLVLFKLKSLETHFLMQHFGRVREYLVDFWRRKDNGYERSSSIMLFG